MPAAICENWLSISESPASRTWICPGTSASGGACALPGSGGGTGLAARATGSRAMGTASGLASGAGGLT